MRLGKTLDAGTSGTNMADEEEFDFEAFYNKHPNEVKAIGGSLLAYFVVFEPLFQWMWDEGTRCGVWGDDYSCQGSVWLTLAYVSIASIVLAPGIWGAASMLVKKFTHVEKTQRDDFVWTVVFLLTGGAIWAILWLYCLPHTWTLLPWGSWDTNWWKIFPFMGLFAFGGVAMWPLAVLGLWGKFNDFAETEKKALDFEVDFKEKLADSMDEGKKFESQELKSLDPVNQPLTKKQEFTSILGDMKIHEKYKK
jgi:hypothetical protein